MSENNEKMNFSGFLSGLMFEGMMSLGVIENPVTKKLDKNLQHAQIVIDTLAMLKEKTSGNLTEEETTNIEDILHQLRLAYVQAVNSDTPKDKVEAHQEEGINEK